MVYILLLIRPNFREYTYVEYMSLVASYMIYAHLFNSFCAVKMNSKWNGDISNEYFYIHKKQTINMGNVIQINMDELKRIETEYLIKQIERTGAYWEIMDEIGILNKNQIENLIRNLHHDIDVDYLESLGMQDLCRELDDVCKRLDELPDDEEIKIELRSKNPDHVINRKKLRYMEGE